MKILITGAAGQLGTAFRRIAPTYPQHQFIFLSRAELDITDSAAATAAIRSFGADALVNCAAYTAVDKAETEQELAYAANATAPGILAGACAAAGIRFVHLSTDYVFSGQGTRPYLESDPVDPVNVYGASKQKGEELVLAANTDAVVIRTSWVYAPFASNFVRTMVRLMQNRPEVGVVADQLGAPTNALDLAEAIVALLDSGKWDGGIYHYSNEGVISWYEFATAIRELGGFSCTINALTTEQYPTPAKRPAYSVMDTRKIVQTFGITLRHWRESLASCMAELQAEPRGANG